MPSIPEIVQVLSYGNKALIKQANLHSGTCYCPVHERGGEAAGHKTPSLGLWTGDTVPIMWKCRSRECDTAEIKKAMEEHGIEFPRAKQKKFKLLKSKQCDVWIHPITEEMIETRPDKAMVNGTLQPINYLYQYADDTGKVLFFRARIEYLQDGAYQKQIRPLAYYSTKDGQRNGWGWVEPPIVPFYYQHLLHTRIKSPVMLVEGEKTADAAQKIYEDYVVISSCNDKKTDWHKLKDRDIVIFPDNDKPGRAKATKIAHILNNICKSVYIVPIWDFNVPKAWDLADPPPHGIEYARFLEKLVLPDQLEMSSIIERCRLVRGKKYDSKDEMQVDIKKMCNDHAKGQPGKHKWPSDENACEYCKCRGVVDRPLDLLETPKILTDWVYIREENRFTNVFSGSTIGPEAFSNAHATLYSKQNNLPTAKQFFTENHLGRQVDKRGFMPGHGIVFDHEGQSMYNMWNIPDSQPVKTSEEVLKPFFDICELLYNNKQEEEIMMDWIAYLIQNLGKTVNWAPILSGVPGCGKDSFFKVVRYMLGNRNCTEVSEIELDSDFWDFGSKQFAVFEETRKHGKWGLYNKLKPFITNDQVLVHRKGVQAYYAPRVTNYCMVTNSDHPLPMDEGDRRWFLVYCPISVSGLRKRNTLDPEFFIRFHKMCDDPNAINGLLHMFMERDLSKFNPKAHAPETEAKRRLIKESRSLSDHILDDLIAQRAWPFYTALFSLNQLAAALKEHDMSFSPQKVGKLIRNDRRFSPMGRARKVITAGGKRQNHTETLFRLTHEALLDVEIEEDARELGILIARIESELEPHVANTSKSQGFLYKACFEKGWLNFDQAPDGSFTKEVRPPKLHTISNNKCPI